MTWKKNLSQSLTSVEALLDFLNLPHNLASEEAAKQFKIKVPIRFANRMQKGNPQDPLLLQVLAGLQEITANQHLATDVLQENQANPVAGIIHKYHGRVLLIATGVCAIHCRYCFRRYFPYETNNIGRKGWLTNLDYVRQNPAIHEVILSGGDPLMMSDTAIEQLLQQLESIRHVKIVRIHTRIPIVLPERITRSLQTVFNHCSLKKVMVIHTNHPNEIDDHVKRACNMLSQAKFILLNQSVLLKDVNDNLEILIQLSYRLFDCGVLPYYLHLLDKVKGVGHFEVSEKKAKLLHRGLRENLPGYLVPRLAREQAGMNSKTLII